MSRLLLEVERWCATVLPPGQRPTPSTPPLYLLNIRPTDLELAQHPASLAIPAYFAGARFAAGELPPPFARPLTSAEAESWMDGWAEHRAEAPAAGRSVPGHRTAVA